MRHSILEAWLEKRSIPFTYIPDIQLSAIKVESGATQNIRLGAPVNEEIVASYALAMENGAQFPAVVLVQRDGQYLVVNGIHRLAALTRIHATQLDAYVLKLDDRDMVDLIRRTINVIEGFRPAEEDLVKQALWFVRSRKYSVQDAATLVGVRSSVVQKVLQMERTKTILGEGDRKFSPAEIRGLQPGMFVTGHAIKNPDLLKKAFRLAYEARLGSDEFKQLVRDMRDELTDQGAERVLEQYRQDNLIRIQQTGAGLTKGPNSPVTTFDRYVRKAESVANKILKDRDESFSLRERKLVIASCERTIKQLQRIIATLKKSKGSA